MRTAHRKACFFLPLTPISVSVSLRCNFLSRDSTSLQIQSKTKYAEQSSGNQVISFRFLLCHVVPLLSFSLAVPFPIISSDGSLLPVRSPSPLFAFVSVIFSYNIVAGVVATCRLSAFPLSAVNRLLHRSCLLVSSCLTHSRLCLSP